MGNRCCGSFFGRIMTTKELELTWPSDKMYKTTDGDKTGLQMRQAFVTRAVTDKLSALTAVNIIYFILAVLVAGLGFSMVPGYSVAIDPTGTGLRVPHSIWFVSSAILIFLWTMCFFFDPYYQVQRIIKRAMIFNGFLLIDLLQNIAHIVLVIIELVQGTTGMASNTSTPSGTFFLVFLVILLGVFIIIDIVIYSVSGNYALLLHEGVMAGWEPGVIGSRKEANKILLDVSGKRLADSNYLPTNNDIRIKMKPQNGLSIIGNLMKNKNSSKVK